jgi:hypothetical protein
MTTRFVPSPNANAATLDAQREAFARRRFLAMPLAGILAWTVIGLTGAFASTAVATLVLYIATGSTVYLGIFLSRFTGEHFGDRSKPKNSFDSLFFLTVAMALLVYAIAIPFALQDASSLPLSVGILTGLMWLPFSWVIQHWVGIAHTLTRTVLILACWFVFPAQRWTLIPAVIIGVYLFTIFTLERRWRARVAAEARA